MYHESHGDNAIRPCPLRAQVKAFKCKATLQGLKYKLGINEFSDMTLDEFKMGKPLVETNETGVEELGQLPQGGSRRMSSGMSWIARPQSLCKDGVETCEAALSWGEDCTNHPMHQACFTRYCIGVDRTVPLRTLPGKKL